VPGRKGLHRYVADDGPGDISGLDRGSKAREPDGAGINRDDMKRRAGGECGAGIATFTAGNIEHPNRIRGRLHEQGKRAQERVSWRLLGYRIEVRGPIALVVFVE
jgi:hypothetical protein